VSLLIEPVGDAQWCPLVGGIVDGHQLDLVAVLEQLSAADTFAEVVQDGLGAVVIVGRTGRSLASPDPTRRFGRRP